MLLLRWVLYLNTLPHADAMRLSLWNAQILSMLIRYWTILEDENGHDCSARIDDNGACWMICCRVEPGEDLHTPVPYFRRWRMARLPVEGGIQIDNVDKDWCRNVTWIAHNRVRSAISSDLLVGLRASWVWKAEKNYPKTYKQWQANCLAITTGPGTPMWPWSFKAPRWPICRLNRRR